MTRLMLRTSSSAMTTAAVMLVGVAFFVGTPRVSAQNPPPPAVCPTEPQNGNCVGTCQRAGEVCTKVRFTYPGGSKRDLCICI